MVKKLRVAELRARISDVLDEVEKKGQVIEISRRGHLVARLSPVEGQTERYNRSLIVDFCSRHGVSSFSFFGSILRDDFNPGSDVDVLIDFAPGSPRSFMKHVLMTRELEDMFKRRVDLCTRRGIASYRQKAEILRTAKEIYVSP
jgi:uncharacterized protein